MVKRASLDNELFKVDLPAQAHDPLETIIPTAPPSRKPKAGISSLTYSRPALRESKSSKQTRNQRSSVGTSEQTIERTNVQKRIQRERAKVRHSFDIFKDQLMDLQALQLIAVQQGRQKPKLGDMVQRAIDLYIKREKSV